MSPLNILLVVLVVAGIWAVVELALTIRKARTALDEVARSANETIEQVQPIVAKLDGAVDDLQPAIKQVDPIVAKASVALDEANQSLEKVNGILSDVSTVSGTAAGVTGVVNQVTTAAADAASGLVSKISGVPQPQPQRTAIGEGDHRPEGADEDAGEGETPHDDGYVTYGAVTAGEGDATEASE